MSFPPNVLGDYETINLILDDRLSFSRFGDGEYRLLMGKGTKTQAYDPELSKRLREILKKPHKRVLVGILDLYSGKPVGTPWPSRAATEDRYGGRRWAERYLDLDVAYGCASVTRLCNWALGDHAAWRDLLRQLWCGRDVLLLTGSQKGLAAEDMLKPDARSVTTMRLAENSHAWSRYPYLLEYCQGWAKTAGDNALVLAALGATATVLAHELGVRGIQALDVGHLPQSWQGISPKQSPEP